jgi:hypothetical protein
MRFLSALLLSLCCLAGSLQGNAVNIPVRSEQASHEYRAVEQSAPNDGLNDYHQISPARITVINNSFQKENAPHFNGIDFNSITAYILNDNFQNSRLLFSGDHAKAFRVKLIFPQHYYW